MQHIPSNAPFAMQSPSQPPDVPPDPTSNLTSAKYQGWDRALTRFLKRAGLFQALNGFENDMLVMNPDVEKEDIPLALEQLRLDLTRLSQSEPATKTVTDERKLEYVHLANDAAPVSNTQLTRSISTFIAQNRARNNASNRSEFLRKRRRVDPSPSAITEEGSSSIPEELPTCARTDAIPVNRDVQMRYDVARNEGGPLRRTVKAEQTDIVLQDMQEDRKGKGRMIADDTDVKSPTLQRHPGLRERFANLETHLAVRYVPSPPESLLDRVRFLEDHLVHLEREYPPWAALHFNQPNRGWPPPPRSTPLIVPSHLTSTLDQPRDDSAEGHDGNAPTTSTWQSGASRPGSARGGLSKPKAKTKSSSLHRTVMQKLEVKKALAGQD